MKRAIGLATLVAATVFAGGACAADPVMRMDSPNFDWNGFYAGLFMGGESFSGNSYFDVGGAAGVLVPLNDMFVGNLEASAAYYSGPQTGWELDLVGRAGVKVDRALLFARAGIGNDTNTSDNYFTYGGGAWLAATPTISLRGEVFGTTYFGNSGVDGVTAQGGLFWHFN